MTGHFPPPLESLPSGATLLETLSLRLSHDPMFAWGLSLFLAAILHTFIAPIIGRAAHKIAPKRPMLAKVLDLFGEIEFIFILWSIPLFAIFSSYKGIEEAVHYFGHSVNYTEPLFVVVIMALAATKPILILSERIIGAVAKLLGGDIPAWWISLLIVGPLLGSLITEPAAITITALLLSRRFYEHKPSLLLSYATLGLLFVNISVGGVLTHFAAPPVVMVAKTWGLTTPYMLSHFGWHAVFGILLNTLLVRLLFYKEFHRMAAIKLPQTNFPKIPVAITSIHLLLLVWTVAVGHYIPLIVFGFLAGIWFMDVTKQYQEPLHISGAVKVGVFLAGLVIFGGLQQWWIAPTLSGLDAHGIFTGAAVLTAFNDNAAITYLVSLVPNLSEELKFAVLAGAVAGGGMTVIANAPNPAGQTLLKRYFPRNSVNPLKLAAAALIPTLILAWAFMGLPH